MLGLSKRDSKSWGVNSVAADFVGEGRGRQRSLTRDIEVATHTQRRRFPGRPQGPAPVPRQRAAKASLRAAQEYLLLPPDGRTDASEGAAPRRKAANGRQLRPEECMGGEARAAANRLDRSLWADTMTHFSASARSTCIGTSTDLLDAATFGS